jgi:hypothetical protein
MPDGISETEWDAFISSGANSAPTKPSLFTAVFQAQKASPEEVNAEVEEFLVRTFSIATEL